MSDSSLKKKRYTLVIPETLYEEVEEVAHVRQVPVIEILRRFIAIGLYVEKQTSAGADFVMKQKDSEERLMFF